MGHGLWWWQWVTPAPYPKAVTDTPCQKIFLIFRATIPLKPKPMFFLPYSKKMWPVKKLDTQTIFFLSTFLNAALVTRQQICLFCLCVPYPTLPCLCKIDPYLNGQKTSHPLLVKIDCPSKVGSRPWVITTSRNHAHQGGQQEGHIGN